MPTTRDLRLMLLVTALFAGLVGAVVLDGLGADVLLVAPLLVLVVPLLGGRYVGEQAIARLAAARRARLHRAPGTLDAPAARAGGETLGHAGRLLGGVYACRPPPGLPTIA